VTSDPVLAADVDTAELLGLALEVAREAGARLLERGRRGDLTWSTKSTPTDVVTEADTASELLIRERLRSARPDDAIVGEEGADEAGTSTVRWVVDPLDGTVNYLYALPGWAVSIAAEVAGASVVGVVHVPTYGETFWARRGGGALRDGRPITASSCAVLDSALLGTGFGYDARRRAVQARWVAAILPEVRDIRRYGSAAVDLCSVACGRLDAYAEQGLKSWDRAAGGLIAAEAGALVTGLRGAPAGERMTLAAPPSLWDVLHDRLVELDADADPLDP
jgi:myo-inositol-1(or 4)-monophosphatase